MSSATGKLPNLIVIGAQKSGTSSLHHYLSLHPDIFMSREKELDFFVENGNWKRGAGWYQRQFQGQAKIRGESSPSYTNYPAQSGVVERMAKLVPNVKLVYLLRDPIERIVSHYVHLVARDFEYGTLEQALKNLDGNHYVQRSMYFMQLEQYLAHFDSARILIITSENLRRERQTTLGRVFDFLEIDKQFDSPAFAQLHHRSLYKRRKTSVGRALERALGRRIEPRLPPALRWRFKFLLYLPFSKPIPPPILTASLRNRLRDALKPDTDRLRAYTGQAFDSWSL